MICRLGKVISVVFLGCAWYTFESSPFSDPQPPVWFVLVALSIFVFFCSRREELQQAEVEHEDDTVFGYDFSQGYTSLERSLSEETGKESRSSASPFRAFQSWIVRRRAERERRRVEQEKEDETRVDEILARLHDGGMHSLTSEDRALLERVSKRYRSRPTQ